ncbi:MAG: helix-turn-helix transcriptional regulator [Oscillospiraceae bacterium]
MDYRELIIKKRKEHDLSQNKLAKLVGVSQPFINEIEKGRKSPSIEVLFKICEVLDITIFPDLDQKSNDL